MSAHLICHLVVTSAAASTDAGLRRVTNLPGAYRARHA